MEDKKKLDKKTIIIISAVVAVLVILGAFLVLGKGNSGDTTTVEGMANKILNEQKYYIDNMQELSKEADPEGQFLEMFFTVNPADVANYKGHVPMMNTKSSCYIVIEPKEGAKDNVLKALNKFKENYDNQWKRYLPDQYELVKQMEIKQEGNLIYVVVPMEQE